MSGAKHHDYHLVNPSVWPLIGSFAALVMFFGLVMFMHDDYFGGVGKWVLGLGFMGVIATFFSWWGDVIKESRQGDHTPVVSIGLRYGMIMFIASEVMFFAAFFWIFFEMAVFNEARAHIPEISNWADAAAYARKLNEVALPHLSDADWDAFARRTFRMGTEGTPIPDYDPDIMAPIRAAGAKALVPNLWPFFTRLAKGRPHFKALA